jgi:hypothetical protein
MEGDIFLFGGFSIKINELNIGKKKWKKITT